MTYREGCFCLPGYASKEIAELIREKKVEPFVHALFGAARASVQASALRVSAGDAASSFAYALGGGLDIKAHNNFAIRLGQVDYLRARAGGEWVTNFRYSVGVVIRLGNR